MAAAVAGHARVGAAAELPRLAKLPAVLPHFFTATAGMLLASRGLPSVSLLLCTLVGGGLVAAAAHALNNYFDRDIDGLMPRTRGRPLPSGRLNPVHALAFGVISGLAGLSLLGRFVGLLTAGLAAAALAYYVLLYTVLLKRRTYWSAIVGSGAGGIPPLMGWAAVAGGIGPTALLLSAIVVFWTLPHFWSLAISRHDEYQRAGIPALPENGASQWITACSLFLVLVTLLLSPAAGLGLLYLSLAAPLGLGFLSLAVRLRSDAAGSARRLYSYSIVYIAVIFAAMIIDRLVSLA